MAVTPPAGLYVMAATHPASVDPIDAGLEAFARFTAAVESSGRPLLDKPQMRYAPEPIVIRTWSRMIVRRYRGTWTIAALVGGIR